MLSSKAPASQITTSDTKLFAIRLSIVKANSMDIKHIIFITNSLGSAKKTVDLSIYSKQAYSLAVCSILKLFFSCGLNHKIKFWSCLSNAE